MTADGEPCDVTSPGAALPDDGMLAAGLGAAAILQRCELPATCSADCQIVACRMPDGSRRQFFCKFGPLAEVPQPTHRFGVAYEAQVYDQLLPAWQDDVPRIARGAAGRDDANGRPGVGLRRRCDVLAPGAAAQGRLDGGRASGSPASIAGARAAAVPSFLHRYDTEFYRVWMERAGHFTRRLHERFPWLADLCEHCQRRLPALLPPATIIHGEYQANNILVRDGRNVVADWESAALAAGEIDLASLTWGWDDDLAALCEQEYCLARWPDGTPGDFALRLTAARVFLHLRWLGDSDEEDGLEAQDCRPGGIAAAGPEVRRCRIRKPSGR